jgi:hypothetical protein
MNHDAPACGVSMPAMFPLPPCAARWPRECSTDRVAPHGYLAPRRSASSPATRSPLGQRSLIMPATDSARFAGVAEGRSRTMTTPGCSST